MSVMCVSLFDDLFTVGFPKRDINNTRSAGLGGCVIKKTGFRRSAPNSYFLN